MNDREIVEVLGPDARPTGRLRMLECDGRGRLQYEWAGYALGWFDVPIVKVELMPARES